MERIEFADHADMAFHNIEEVTAGGHPLLGIKALIFHSLIVADHVDLYHELDAVQILIAAAVPTQAGIMLSMLHVAYA